MKHSLDKRRRPKRRPIAFETLEPRLLLSADLAPALAPFAHDALPPIPAEHRSLEAMAELPRVVMAQEAARASELVFVDASLPDYQRLVADVLRATGGERPVEVLLLDPSRDGVAQMTEALASRTGLAAVHLVTHGGDGRLQLGETILDAATLEANSDAVAGWARAFAADGDLLLYGCNVAETARGGAFIDALALLTGADVAASDDRTGSAQLGGDWDLERTTGAIALPLAFGDAPHGEWFHTLAADVLDWDAIATAGTWTSGTLTPPALTTQNGGSVVFTVTGDIGLITANGTPEVSTQVNGGTGENTLRLLSSGFAAAQSVIVTLDFSAFAGGVSDVSFSVFDVDSGAFIDRVSASSNLGIPPSLTPSAYNAVSGASSISGDGVSNAGDSESFANATYVFAQSGIASITIVYSNDGAPALQGIGLHDIVFTAEVDALNDAASTTENATLNVAAAGVLSNDADNRPFTGTVTPGATLNYNAATDTGGNSAWTDDTGVAGFDWQFLSGFGLPVSATPASTVTAFAGLTSAYSFGGTVQEASGTSFESLAGDPSDADASFEIWFKPADLADNDILFETGGNANTGLAILLDNDILTLYVEDGNTVSATASANLTALLGSASAVTGEYIHVVAVYDRDASGTNDAVRLYVNGQMVVSDTTQTALHDWSANNGAGLGGANGSISTPGGSWTRFEGAISRFRFYQTAMTDAQVQSNFNVVAEGLAVSAVNGQVVRPGTGTTVTLASGATVTMRADGGYTYNPNGAFNYLLNGQTATDSFTYTITDHAVPAAHTDTATVTITINGISANAAPAVGGLGTLSYAENDAATLIAAGATVTDADSPDFGGGSLTVSFTANGTAADQLAIRNEGTGAGQIGVSGSDVTYGGTIIGSYSGGANGTNLVVTLNTNATVAAVQALARNVTFANTSNTPSTSSRNVSFTVTDGDGGSASANATVNVAAVNDAPTIAAPASIAVSEDVASVLTGISFADVDAGAGSVTATLTVASGTLAATSGGGVTVGGTPTALTLTGSVANINSFIAAANVAFTTALNATAAVTLGVAVDDGGNTGVDPGSSGTATSEAASTTVALNVTAVNDAPTITAPASIDVTEDVPSALTGISFADVDAVSTNATVTLTVPSGTLAATTGGGVTVGGTATALTLTGSVANINSFIAASNVTFTSPLNTTASVTLTVVIDDRGNTGIDPGTSGTATSEAASAAVTLNVTAVNDAPTFAALANQTLAEDAGAQTVAGFATVSAGGGADEAGQSFSYVVTNDTNPLFTVQPTLAANGTLTYTLAPNAIGSATVTAFVTDSGGTANGGADTTGPRTFTITATPVADTPAVTNAATLEDTQTSSGLVITRNATDGVEVTHFKITGIAGGTLFLSDGTTAVANGTFVTAAEGAAGLKLTPAPNSVANGAFDLQASTAANDTGLGGSVVTATITVTPVNDAPNLAALANQTRAEDAGAQIVAGFTTVAPGGGADEAGQSFSYTVTNDNNTLFTVQPTIAANGTLTYSTAANVSGAATVTAFVIDSGGTANGGFDTTGPRTFTITATPVADAPTLTVNPATGNEDAAIGLSIARALVDTDGSEILALTVSAIPVGATLSDGTNTFTASAGNQSVAITSWNLAALTVTPPANSDVDFTLAVAATATETANGAIATTNANLAVTVNAIADVPTLAVNAASGNEDTAIALSAAAAIVDGDGSETLAVTAAGIPVGATLSDGTNAFTATAGNQSVAVTGWNLALLRITPPSDADTDFALTVTATATEALGGSAASATANLAVDVIPVNDAPTIAAPPAMAVVEDVASPITGIVIGDVDGTAGPVSVTLSVPSGTLAAASGAGVLVAGSGTGALALIGTTTAINAFLAAGNVAFTTALDATGPVPLSAFVNDLGNLGAGGPLQSPTIGVTLNVTAVNDAPVLGPVGLSIDPLQIITMTGGNMSATDVDNSIASLVFLVAGTANGQFELTNAPGVAVTSFTQGQLAAGQVRFVHTSAGFGPSFSIFVTDGAAIAGPGVAVVSFRAPGTETPVAAKQPDPAPAPIVAGADALATGASGLSDPTASDFLRTPYPRSDVGAVSFAEAPAETAIVLAQPVRGAALLDLRASIAPGNGFVEAERIPTDLPRVDFGITAVRHDETPRSFDVAFDSARITGMALSVGTVWWAARAGGLLASLLASTPAWRHVDPLPVLGRDDDEPEIDWQTPDNPRPDEETSEATVFDDRLISADHS